MKYPDWFKMYDNFNQGLKNQIFFIMGCVSTGMVCYNGDSLYSFTSLAFKTPSKIYIYIFYLRNPSYFMRTKSQLYSTEQVPLM